MPEVIQCARSEMAAMTPSQLYRRLLVNLRKLPPDAQAHYKHYIRQSFSSHSDETDPERIKQIMFRALEDMEWLVKKYKK